METLFSSSRAWSDSCRELAVVKRRSRETETVFGGLGQIQFAGNQDGDQFRAATSYDHHRGEPYAAIRPIAQRIAGQPILVGRVLRGKEAKKGFKPWQIKGMPGLVQKTLTAENAGVELIERHPVLEVLSDPNARMIQHTLMECSVVSMQLTGRCYWWLAKSPRRMGFDIWPLPSSWVKEEPNNANLDQGWVIAPPYSQAEEYKVKPDRMVYFYHPDPSDPFKSHSPMRAAVDAVQVDESIQTSQRRGFENGLFPALALITGDIIDPTGKNLGKPQYERWQLNELQARIDQLYKGENRSGSYIVLDRTIADVKPITTAPREMDWTNSGTYNRDRIWRMFGTPRMLAGDPENANRATAVVADEVFCANVVNPLITLMSQVIQDNLLPLYDDGSNGELVLWIEEASPNDKDGRRNEIKLLIDHRALTVDELRAESGFAPLPNDMGQVLISSATQIFDPIDGSVEPHGAGDRFAQDDSLDTSDTPGLENDEGKPAEADPEGSDDEESAKAFQKDYAARWLKVHGRHEDRFAVDLSKYFNQQAEAAAAGYEAGDRDPAKLLPYQKWTRALAKSAKPHILRASMTGAMLAMETNKGAESLWTKDEPLPEDEIVIDLPPEVLRAVKESVEETMRRDYWQDMVRVSRDRLGRAIVAAQEAKENLTQTVARIKAALGGDAAKVRAIETARSETTGALNSGSNAVISRLISEGTIEGKWWLATADEHVRDTHWAANGSQADSDGNFTVGGEKAPYPGFSGLSAANRVNCRCSLVGTPPKNRQPGNEPSLHGHPAPAMAASHQLRLIRSTTTLPLFVYGSLRNKATTDKVVGRDVDMSHAAKLHGFVRKCGTIEGGNRPRYCMLEKSAGGVVQGKLLELSDAELNKTDQWETLYQRQEVEIEGGVKAWAYFMGEKGKSELVSE